MRAPLIFVVVECRGDGWGHNSYSYTSWHFDEREANARAVALKESSGEFTWFNVEAVPPPDPIED